MAVLHVKTPNGNTYNMTIVTSGVTESSFDSSGGWCKIPNGLIIQWGRNRNVVGDTIYFPISFPNLHFIGSNMTLGRYASAWKQESYMIEDAFNADPDPTKPRYASYIAVGY